MNYRTLPKDGKIEEPKFQAILDLVRLTQPEVSEEDLLDKLASLPPVWLDKMPAEKIAARIHF
jgi:hypothetical protein